MMSNLARLLDHLRLAGDDVRQLVAVGTTHPCVLDYIEESTAYGALRERLKSYLLSENKRLRAMETEHLERAGHYVTLVKGELRVYLPRTPSVYVHTQI